MPEVIVEPEGPEWAVFRVSNGRIHCKAFFATKFEAEIRADRLRRINAVLEED